MKDFGIFLIKTQQLDCSSVEHMLYVYVGLSPFTARLAKMLVTSLCKQTRM